MIQIDLEAAPSAFSELSSAAAAGGGGRRIGKDPDPGAPSAAVEDQPLFVSPPPLPFPRVYPGL